MRYLWILCFSFYLCISCSKEPSTDKKVFGTEDINRANRKLLEIAMEDGFSPPIASRVYVYPHIAHYLALRAFYPDSLPAIAEKLNGMPQLAALPRNGANAELTALVAFTNTAQKLVFSEHYMQDYREELKKQASDRGLDNSTIDASVKCADSLTKQLLAWIAKDNYTETRTMDRFTSAREPGLWRETSPDYQQALESHWMKIRPLVIDSARCIPVTKPPSFSHDKTSDFYRMVERVYTESKNLDSNKISTAWFWDDNPNVTVHKGHMVSVTHKVSPPGHWLNIIHQVSEKEKSDLFKTTCAYTFTAIAMFDGIISCWCEKFSCNLVRPISYIQEYIDPQWASLIQTPPFPEWTSGHSVLSAAAATVLTDIYGDRFSFSDSTGTLYGQPVRSFPSFHDAAWEVSLSRFYAGIHYYESIEEGNKQGKKVGDMILKKLKP